MSTKTRKPKNAEIPLPDLRGKCINREKCWNYKGCGLWKSLWIMWKTNRNPTKIKDLCQSQRGKRWCKKIPNLKPNGLEVVGMKPLKNRGFSQKWEKLQKKDGNFIRFMHPMQCGE